MAIFQVNNNRVELIKLSEFKLEKDLQKIIEGNLETIFNCRFVATEFSTGSIHSGRIDTLAISEDNNPVIIEYKKVASSDLINQSLYYLHWMMDHRGDFQLAVQNSLGDIKVDWSEIRVICLAPEYKKYDLQAVQVIGANIELWQYKIYSNGILNLEEVYKRSDSIQVRVNETQSKDPKMVEAGKKAAITRKNANHNIEDHLEILDENLKRLFVEVRDHIISLDNNIEETPKQNYIAYKTSQNFVCLETHKNKLTLFLKVNPSEVNPHPNQCRDVRSISHFGTGDLELVLRSLEDFEQTKFLINESLKNIGG
ncbi:MAG: hypothetical protein KF763_13740 [Cyclobacteriaceae bacterium]|nr:hypothetical protein [Cyclobacteriaceae bacterium]